MANDRAFALPEQALSEKFITASGPGGQNVNKVASACQLRVDVTALGLHPDATARLKRLAGSRMTAGGELVITAQRFRTQEGNRADARARAEALIARALVRPERRIATKPGKAAKARRIDAKKARGTVKAARGRVTQD
ncbi:MAG: alternative ribosome rescue aminoacyl-tRNA hydrolase ArfB [Sphingopyxis sp.]